MLASPSSVSVLERMTWFACAGVRDRTICGSSHSWVDSGCKTAGEQAMEVKAENQLQNKQIVPCSLLNCLRPAHSFDSSAKTFPCACSSFLNVVDSHQSLKCCA